MTDLTTRKATMRYDESPRSRKLDLRDILSIFMGLFCKSFPYWFISHDTGMESYT